MWDLPKTMCELGKSFLCVAQNWNVIQSLLPKYLRHFNWNMTEPSNSSTWELAAEFNGMAKTRFRKRKGGNRGKV